MFILFNKNRFFIMLISIAFVFASDEAQAESEAMCVETRGVLCVKQVLEMIADMAKNLSRTTNEMEKNITKTIPNVDRLNSFVKSEIRSMRSHLPTSQYHVQFSESNNIDKEFLGDLSLEAHYAMSFYYNSIRDLLNTKNVHTWTTDASFKELQLDLRHKIICRYRSILDVYSREWPLIHQIKRIQFSRKKYHNAPSLDRDIHSIIILQLLSEWMQTLHNVTINVEGKFY